VPERSSGGGGECAGLGLGENRDEGSCLAAVLLRLDRRRALATALGDGKLVECVAPSVGHVDEDGVRSEKQPPSDVVANEVVHVAKGLRGEP